MEAYLGELAALATSLSFSFGSSAFTIAGRRIGSLVVNRIRLVFAVIFLSLTHWVMLGSFIPFNIAPERWFWFGLSGIVGLVIGDIFLFQSFVLVGPRIAMLMMSLAPIIAALQAWAFLGEALKIGQVLGIFITLAGIMWVVVDGKKKNGGARDYKRGIIFGLGAAIGQASGLVLAKRGFGGDFSPISANLIRMLSAMVVLWLLTLLQGQIKSTLKTLRKDKNGVLFAGAGAFFGPFLGVTLSLFAIQHIEVGVVSTLTSLPPIFLLPISYFFFKEEFGWGSIAGTLLAMAGVALLFLV